MQAVRSIDPSGTTVLRHIPDNKGRGSWTRWLIGRPLPTEAAPHQTIGKLVGLAVFASDALSSTAYATEEMLVVLVAGGAAALAYAFPLSLVIVGLLVILTVSYEQTIHAYPGGGGAYIVARDNLGEVPAQTAGAALLTDYILTVAVSISSGVAQIASAFPALDPYRVTSVGGVGALYNAGKPEGRERIGSDLCRPDLFLSGNDVLDRRHWPLPVPDRFVGPACRCASGGNGRMACRR